MTGLPPGMGGVLVLPASKYARDRRPWLEARRRGLGASDTAAILGLNPWATPLQVWQEKVDTSAPADEPVSEAAEWGSILEAPLARQTVARHPELGKLVPSPGLLQHPDHPWMLATIDRGLTPRGGDGTVTAILECKTTSEQAYKHHWIDGLPPTFIQVQVQQQLAVTGLDVAWVTCLVGGQRLADPVRVERSDDVIEQLIHYGGLWWRDHVEAGVRPEPTFGDRADLSRVYVADESLDAVTADDELLDIVARHADAIRRRREADAEAEELAFAIKNAMGESTAIKRPDGVVVTTWKPQPLTTFNKRAFAAAHPDLAAEYTTRRETRVLRHKRVTSDA